MSARLRVIFCIFICSIQAYGQKIDSLLLVLHNSSDTLRVNTLLSLSNEYLNNDTDSAIYYATQSYIISEKIDFKKGNISSSRQLGRCYQGKGNYDSAILYYKRAISKAVAYKLPREEAFTLSRMGRMSHIQGKYIEAIDALKKALVLFQNLDSKLGQADTYLYLGQVYDEQGNYSAALDNYFKALNLDKLLGNTLNSHCNNIAIIYKKQENIPLALDYYNKALKLSLDENDALGVAITKVNIALIHKYKKDYDKALKTLNEALETFKTEEYKYAEMLTQHNIGIVYDKKKQFSKALSHLDTALVFSIDLNARKTTNKTYKAIADIHLQKGELNLALSNAYRGLEIAKDTQSPEDIEEVSLTLSNIYTSLKDHKQAFQFYKIHIEIKDSLFSLQKSKEITALEGNFKISEKEKEISMLESEAALQIVETTSQKNLNLALITGLALLGILLLVTTLAYRYKHKANKDLQLQKEEINSKTEEILTQREDLVRKNSSLKELNVEKNDLIAMVAHDLRSPLNQIKGLLELTKSTKLNPEQEEYIGITLKSTDRLRDMINRTLDMKAIEAKKINMHPEVFDLLKVIKAIVFNFLKLANRKNLKILTEQQNETYSIYADKNYCIQIFENLLSNAIKFSPKNKKITIRLSKNDPYIVTEVMDEGPGINKKDKKLLFGKFQKLSARPTQNEESTGLGLAIVKKYVEAMDGHVRYENREETGANFIVEFNSATS